MATPLPGSINPSNSSQIPHQSPSESMGDVSEGSDISFLSDPPPSDDEYWVDIDKSPDLNDPTTAMPSASSSQKRRERQRCMKREKLNRILKFLSQKAEWAPATFIRSFITKKDKLSSQRYKTQYLRHKEMRKIIYNPLFFDLFLSGIQEEFINLIKQQNFGKYDENTDIDHLNLQDMYHTIEKIAPLWSRFLSALLVGPRNQDITNQGPLISITSMICYSRAPVLSNFLAKSLSVYLHGTGAKSRCLDTLNGLGICSGYLF